MRQIVEFPVLTRGIPHRSTKERHVLLTDRIEVEIPEARRSETSDVARVENREDHHIFLGYAGVVYERIANRAAMAEGQVFSHFLKLNRENDREFENRVWSPLAFKQEAILRDLRYQNGTGSALDTHLFPKVAADVVAGRNNLSALGYFHEFQFKELSLHALEATRDFMRGEASKLLLVDGELWRQCRPPLVTYIPHHGAGAHRAIDRRTVMSPLHVPLRNVMEAHTWELRVISSLADMESGYDIAVDISRRFGGGGPDFEVRQTEHIELLDPSYFRDFDPTAAQLLHTACAVRDWITHKYLRPRGPYDKELVPHKRLAMNMQTLPIECLVLLKSLVTEISVPEEDLRCGVLADLLRQATDMPSVRPQGRDPEFARVFLERIVEEWENRPIEMPTVSPSITP